LQRRNRRNRQVLPLLRVRVGSYKGSGTDFTQLSLGMYVAGCQGPANYS
jgi:hypothetical protein